MALGGGQGEMGRGRTGQGEESDPGGGQRQLQPWLPYPVLLPGLGSPTPIGLKISSFTQTAFMFLIVQSTTMCWTQPHAGHKVAGATAGVS